jgi:ribosomal protein S18 acetylase RimI-like enzyme
MSESVIYKICQKEDNSKVSLFFRAIYKELGWPILHSEGVDDATAFFKDHNGVLFIAIKHNDVIATAGLAALPDGNAVLKRFYVHPDHRGTDIAPQLLEYTLQNAKQKGYKELFLDVRKNNTRAVRFWEKNHFQPFKPQTYKKWEETSYKPELRLFLKRIL